MYRPDDEQDAIGVLEFALKAVIETEGLESKLRRAQREGQLSQLTASTRLQEALERGLITTDEFAAVSRARRLKREVIMVDDFDAHLANPDSQAISRTIV
jgi:acyl-CoA dehydrogenase